MPAKVHWAPCRVLPLSCLFRVYVETEDGSEASPINFRTQVPYSCLAVLLHSLSMWWSKRCLTSQMKGWYDRRGQSSEFGNHWREKQHTSQTVSSAMKHLLSVLKGSFRWTPLEQCLYHWSSHLKVTGVPERNLKAADVSLELFFIL